MSKLKLLRKIFGSVCIVMSIAACGGGTETNQNSTAGTEDGDRSGEASPVANDDAATVAAFDQIDINVVLNDTDPDLDLIPASVSIVAAGTQGTATANGDGTVTYLHTGTGTQDTFTYRVQDAKSNFSNLAMVTVNITIPVGGVTLPAEGLALRLESDMGITTTGGCGGVNCNVTSWADQSPEGNDFQKSPGDPQLVNNVFGDKPGVTFPEPEEDWLIRSSTFSGGISGMAEGNADRSVYLVADYSGVGNAISIGRAGNGGNKAFNLTANADGNFGLDSWGGNNVFPTTVNALVAGPVIQSAILSDGTLKQYIDGTLVATNAHTFDTELRYIVLGANINLDVTTDVAIGAVLIYNGAHGAAAQANVKSYLQSKFFGGLSSRPPIAANDSHAVDIGSFETIDVTANDFDSNGDIDTATVVVENNGSEGSAVANGDGTVTYTHTGSGTSDTYDYTVTDTSGLMSNQATVAVTIDIGDIPPVAADDAITVIAGNPVTLNVAANDNDANNNLDQTTVVITSDGSEGTATANGNGTVTYNHTGGGSRDTFQYEISDLMSLTSNAATVTITVLPGGNRVSTDQQVLYRFNEGSGTTVADESGVTPALDLAIQNNAAVTWGTGTLLIDSTTTLESAAANRLNDAIMISNEVTVEAWLTPANATQTDLARIVSLSASPTARNVTLGQMTSQANVRLRSTTNNLNGTSPSVTSNAGALGTSQVHLVYTRATDGTAKIYVNNSVVATATITGDLSTWESDYKLILANEVDGSRAWLGELDLVAIYSRALSSTEVEQNFSAGSNGP